LAYGARTGEALLFKNVATVNAFAEYFDKH
jgi:hypothetical protein